MESESNIRKSKVAKCPKCGGEMVKGVCVDCNYSAETAYLNKQEAKESTYGG